MRSGREEQASQRYGRGRKASFYSDDQSSSDLCEEVLTAEKLVELLERYGTIVTKTEAEIILEFMSRWAKFLLPQCLEK
jgi:hypothetical protein